MVKGDSACSCYWNQHERTKQTIEGEWVRTGDKYHRDADGCFWYAGRTDDMIKAGGMWVSPAEVEGALAGHPAVVEAGVVGAEDKDELVKPLAFVVLARGHLASPTLEAELKAFVKERVAAYKRSEEHTSELQSLAYLVCRLLLEKKKRIIPSPLKYCVTTTTHGSDI